MAEHAETDKANKSSLKSKKMVEKGSKRDKSEKSSKKLLSKKLVEQSAKFDFDGYLKSTLGEFGRYQQVVALFICIPGCLLSSFSSMDLVFMAYTPEHSCFLRDANYSSPNSSEISTETALVVGKQCEYVYYYRNGSERVENFTEKCDTWTYDRKYFDRTIVTQWNLVCDEAITIRTILSLLNLSTFLAVGFTYIQDRWGRKRAFLLNLTIFLGGTCGSLLAPSPSAFAVLKFVGGISCMYEICYCWALEFVGPTQRTCLSTMLNVVYGLATMSLGLVAYLCRTWVEMGLVTSAPFVLLYSYASFVPESPRWLLSQGRVDEALVIMESMAKWNRVKIDIPALRNQILGPCLLEDVINIPPIDGIKQVEKTKRKTWWLNLKQVFASPNIRCKIFTWTFVAIAEGQLYSAIPYTIENLEANFYVSYVLQAGVEVPATLVNLVLLNKYGRILPLATSLLLAAVCCLLTWPLQGQGPWCGVVLAAMSRFFVCTADAITDQLAHELFPTVSRGTCLAVTYFASSFASVATQYIVYSSHVWEALPMLVLGCFALAGGCSALFLPETMGKSMPDTVPEAESQGAVGCIAFREHFKRTFKCCR